MWLHITFKDGSNPYVKYRLKTENGLKRELKKWEKNYDLTVRRVEQLSMLGEPKLIGFDVTAKEKAERRSFYDESETDCAHPGT